MNLDKMLPYLERFMEPGDYLLVEDTHPSANSRIDQGMWCPVIGGGGSTHHAFKMGKTDIFFRKARLLIF